MLFPNKINKEPYIRIGIILPSDKYQELEINTPPSPLYKACGQNQEWLTLSPCQSYNFTLENGTVYLQGREIRLGASFWEIVPSISEIASQKGIVLHNIIAGRDFHWKKKITEYLPGKILVENREESIFVVNELLLEDYITCVVMSEMGKSCPNALIKSQAIAARSWTLAQEEKKHIVLGIDLCNDDCCQRYQGTESLTDTSIRCVQETRGVVLVSDKTICDTRYSKSCGGITESFENIWAGEARPYLSSISDTHKDFSHPALPLSNEQDMRGWLTDVPSSFCSPKYVNEDILPLYLGRVDEKGRYFRWRFEISEEELRCLINKRTEIEAQKILRITPVSRGSSGRLKELKISYINNKGKEEAKNLIGDFNIRRAFHPSFLYSSCFIVEQTSERSKFIIHGGGWGHGVGLCQIGALGMALAGYSDQQILSHYYKSAQLEKLY